MKPLTIEMPVVSVCEATQCAYNVNRGCHAKAITVGDGSNPDCDTFFASMQHNKEARRQAGVGACKVTGCKFNRDFECNADSIQVGFADQKVNCLTFTPRP